MNTLRFILVVIALATGNSATCSPAGSRQRTVLPPGNWGGDHITMSVTSDGAELEFDCASGTISGPIVLDPNGKFRATGSYRAEHPAPSQAGETQQPETIFTGSVKDDTMHLQIKVDGLPDKMDFTLTRGQEGHLTKCA